MTADSTNVLRVTRRFDASPERVFEAWIKPETAWRWLFTSPAPDGTDRGVDIAAEVGGGWRIARKEGGREPEAVGEYLEIDPPRLIVFTFAMPQLGPEVDLVAVEIVPDGEGCILTLTHERRPPRLHG